MLQIQADWATFIRCLGALLWGVGYALFIQHNRMGKFIADERTWLSVVIGVGVDMLIGIGAAWYEMWIIVACSSVGIIARSLINEQKPAIPSGYKVLWGIEDSIALAVGLIGDLEALLETASDGKRARALSQALSRAQRIARYLRAARKGEYNRE